MKLTPNEVATRLGKSRRQVIYMIENGHLPAQKIGGRWVIDQADLPLGGGQQQARERKQRRVHAALAEALEVSEERQRRYSLGDLKAYQIFKMVHDYLDNVTLGTLVIVPTQSFSNVGCGEEQTASFARTRRVSRPMRFAALSTSYAR